MRGECGSPRWTEEIWSPWGKGLLVAESPQVFPTLTGGTDFRRSPTEQTGISEGNPEHCSCGHRPPLVGLLTNARESRCGM